MPDAELDVRGVSSSSGVSDQPGTDAETRLGARNRSRDAQQQHPDADYFVGIEGGIDVVGEQLLAFAWMCVDAGDGRSGEARSATLPLPGSIRQLINDGLELGDAIDEVFATTNSKQGGGAFGLLTDGLYTRESVYAESLVFALLPLIKDVYR